MKSNAVRISLTVIAASFVGLILYQVFKSDPPVENRQAPPKAIRVLTVEKADHNMIVRSQGSVAPRTESMLVSEVAGRVVQTTSSFVAGGFFKEKDMLIKIDPGDYQLAVTQAGSQVAQAKRAYQVEEQQSKIAREEWSRLNEGEIPPLAAREPQLAEAEAMLAAAKANLRKAELNLNRTRVSAPFVGRVRTKNVDVGQYVTPGTPLGIVYAVDYAEVRLPVPDEQLAFIDMPYNFQRMENKRGPKVTLKARFAGADQQWEGYLTRIEGEIDPQSRMIYVVARVEDPYGLKKEGNPVPLTVGLFVEAEIAGTSVPNITVVPRDIIRNGNQVLVVKDDKLSFRDVDIIKQEGDYAYIKHGLQDGEQVCISPLSYAVEGMLVTIIDGKDDSSTLAGGEGQK